MEKIKPIKSKSSILSLKFQRKSDYTKFLKFIQVETKKLKGIVEPKENKLKDILKVGGVGLLGLGLFNLVGKGKDAINKTKGQGDFQIPFAIGRARDKDIKSKGSFNIKPFGEKPTGQSQKIKTPVKTSVTKKVSKPVKTKVKNPVKKNINVPEKSLVGSGDTRRQGPGGQDVGGTSGGTGDRPTSGKIKGNKINIDKIFEKGKNISKNILKENIDPKNLKNALSASSKMGKLLLRETEMIVDANGKIFFLGIGNNKIPLTGEVFQQQFGKDTFFFADASPSNFQLINDVRGKRGLAPLERSFDISQDIKSAEEILKNKSKIISKPNIFKRLEFTVKRFMNWYNQGRNVRFPDENNAKLIDLFLDDRSQMTQSDEAFKTGKKGIRTLRPLKAFLDPKMRATGPTPLIRQVIERPFRSLFSAGASGLKFLKNNPLVNALLKSRVVKGGLFVIDAIFAGQEFYDLFLRPGDNVYTTLHDLYVSINNAYFQNDPERLKYFIKESKGSHSSLFGPSFTNEQIRKKEIERNLKIKRLKEAAAVEGGGGNNIIVVPQSGNKRGSGVSNNEMPRQTGGDDISFVPFEPLNIGDDILLHKLNQ